MTAGSGLWYPGPNTDETMVGLVMAEDPREGAQRLLYDKIDALQLRKNREADRAETLSVLRHRVSMLFAVLWSLFVIFLMACVGYVAFKWAFR